MRTRGKVLVTILALGVVGAVGWSAFVVASPLGEQLGERPGASDTTARDATGGQADGTDTSDGGAASGDPYPGDAAARNCPSVGLNGGFCRLSSAPSPTWWMLPGVRLQTGQHPPSQQTRAQNRAASTISRASAGGNPRPQRRRVIRASTAASRRHPSIGSEVLPSRHDPRAHVPP